MSHRALGVQFLKSGSQEHSVPAGKLFSATKSWDAHSYSLGDVPEHEMWQQKLDTAVKSGLAGDIADRGVQEPLTYDVDADGSLHLMNGHHRLISAVAANPHMKVPLRITDSSFDAYADF